MGAWGSGIFESDTTMDFLGGLADHPENADNVLREALETAAHTDGYLDADEGGDALAAAAIVSVAKGDSPLRFDEPVDGYLRKICRHVPDGLGALAVEALDRVLGDESELRELWAEADALQEWEAEPHTVRQHLTAS